MLQSAPFHTCRVCGVRLASISALLLALTALASASASPAFEDLEQSFRNPPVSARPYVWWHWMGPNFSESGITKDLEAMAASGIGGATIFNLTSAVQESHAPTQNNPWPENTYRSPGYWSALRHAATEARRLGLEIGLHNTAGYSTTGGPWIDEERGMQRLLWSETKVAGGRSISVDLPVPVIPSYKGWGATGETLSFFRDVAILAVPASAAPGEDLRPTDVIELSAQARSEGDSLSLTWDAPPGDWILYRFVHAPTGASPHPVPDDLLGRALEADKMSLAQTHHHWSNVLDPLREHLGPLLGDSFRHILIDSYEAGPQTWTPGFRDEFIRRKGYDPLPWIVTLGAPITGNPKSSRVRILGSEAETARFEWDYRDVVATLFHENGWKPAAERIRTAGLQLHFEPYTGPFDSSSATTLADVPMIEFWTGGDGGGGGWQIIIGSARAAGIRLLGAEAFTGRPEVSKWTETPGFLKRSADGAFGGGVNRMVLHHWVHQPFDDHYQPGMGMGWWGTHFSRHQTWAEPGKEFYRYLGRVQALLQRGETPIHHVSVGGPSGGDVISTALFLSGLEVENGQVVLPSGRRYAFIHVPHDGTLLPEVLREMERLLESGATVVSSRPVRSPSLAGYPGADAEVQAIAERLWGDSRAEETVRQIGSGFLHTKGDVGAAMAKLGLEPFFKILGPDVQNLRVHHRREGDCDLYFVANVNDARRALTLSALVSGRQPELWDAETGSIMDAPQWRTVGSRTEVDLSLEASKSVFVVFRRTLPAGFDPIIALDAPQGVWVSTDDRGRPVARASFPASGIARFASGRTKAFELSPLPAIAVDGPWDVTLTPKLGETTHLQLPSLVSLSTLEHPSAKFFSGTATYRTTLEMASGQLPKDSRVHLDLGDVRELVSVRINGQDLGVWWHGPFVRDVTQSLIPGKNTLEIAVTNTWHNRLVGDEQEPADFEFGTDRGEDKGRALLRYPDWFLTNQPRPSKGRIGFVNWFYHRAGTPLLPAGLLGPVRLIPVAQSVLTP